MRRLSCCDRHQGPLCAEIAICKVVINNLAGWRDRPRSDFATPDQRPFTRPAVLARRSISFTAMTGSRTIGPNVVAKLLIMKLKLILWEWTPSTLIDLAAIAVPICGLSQNGLNSLFTR